MRQGKDLYIEKPISHVYDEGPKIIAAAKKYGRVVQQGSQMRSSPVSEKAGRLLKDGIIGEIKVARHWTAEPRSVLKPQPDGPPRRPESTTTAGSAPRRGEPSTPIASTAPGGSSATTATARSATTASTTSTWPSGGWGSKRFPKQITAHGGRMSLHGNDGDYPDNLNVTYEYPDGRLLVYENYPFAPYGLPGFDDGNVFYGTEGYMVFSAVEPSVCSSVPRPSPARPRGPPSMVRPAIPNTWQTSSTPSGIGLPPAPRRGRAPELRPGPPRRDCLSYTRPAGFRPCDRPLSRLRRGEPTPGKGVP